MLRFIVLSGLFFLTLLVAAGCTDDPVIPPVGDESLVRVELDPDGADFTIKLESVDTPGGRVPGPFFLRGHNLHYNDVVGALVVDLTITNNSPATFLNPVHITFLRLLPEGTIILNSPDDGPTFEFDFANDDLWWTPGEESLLLTVMFKADLGGSVGFNAHISVGGVHLEGMIGGRVWLDANRDGVMDPDERGLPGIPIGLSDGSDREILHRAITGEDGRYMFRGLDAGTYEVWVHDPPAEMSSTTPINMHVLLSSGMGGVSSFTEADFGFVRHEVTPPGPKLVVNGNHMDQLIAFRGETIMDLRVSPGTPVFFRWEGFADRGLEIKAYRWGWDVIDPDDPQDSGWGQNLPGLGPQYMEAVWGGPLEPGQTHRLVIHCWDTEDHLTRVMIHFRVDAP